MPRRFAGQNTRTNLDRLTSRWRSRHDLRREGDPFRPRANPGREALARRGFPYHDVTPADYVAEHAADMVGFTYDDESYVDAELDAWIVEVGELLREQRDGGTKPKPDPDAPPDKPKPAAEARGLPSPSRPPSHAPNQSQSPSPPPMAEAPAWARSLVMTVCAEADASLPRLTWRHRDRPTSSGVTRQSAGIVSVVAGRDPIDQRLTLLHELAHWVTPIPRNRRRRISHHDAAFYDAAFALYRRHGVPDATALAGESARYPSSLAHARRLGVPGAEEAWRDRRSALRERAQRRPPMRVLVPEHGVRLVRDGRWTRCAVCGIRVVGPNLRRLRRRPGRHVLLGIA